MKKILCLVLLLNGCALFLDTSTGSDASIETLALLRQDPAAFFSNPDDNAPADATPGQGTSASANFNGPAAHAAYPSDITTSDSSSGLIWTSCAAGQSGLDCAGSATSLNWSAAAAYCAGLNSANGGAGFAARVDWRVPTVKELSTLLDYNRDSPAVNTTHFPNTFHVLAHWTSDIYPSATGFAYGIGFKFGGVSANARTGGLYTRCVAGTLAPASAFSHSGDGSVLDSGHGLMWTRCTHGATGGPANGTGFDCAETPGFLDWVAAGQACANLTFAGHADWRLPAISELKSLIDQASFDPAANTAVFPNIPAGAQYWSATQYNPFPGSAWRIDSRYGLVSPATKSSLGQVRCVRRAM